MKDLFLIFFILLSIVLICGILINELIKKHETDLFQEAANIFYQDMKIRKMIDNNSDVYDVENEAKRLIEMRDIYKKKYGYERNDIWESVK